MRKLLFLLALLLLVAPRALATDVTIQAATIPNFNPRNLNNDVTVTVSATNGSPTVTSAGLFRADWIGLGGFRVAIGGTAYTVDYVSSASSLTLTANYAGATGSASLTLYRYAELRIYVDPTAGPFQPLGKTYVVQTGAPGSGAWYRRIVVSVVNEAGVSTLYIPQIGGTRALDATTDSPTNNLARYRAAFYTPSGALIQDYECFRDFALPPTTPTTWADICTYNSTIVNTPDVNAYTRAQIDARFPTCTAGQLDYFAATGNAKQCLTIGTGLSIAGGVISAAAGSGITIDTTPISGGSLNNLLYHGSGNVVRELSLGTTLAISGGVLKAQNVKNAVSLIDYGADPTGVGNSTAAVNAWLTACVAAGAYECYAPGGTYEFDTITASINGVMRITGDGRSKTIFRARTANTPIFNLTATNSAVNFTIRGIGFEGRGKASGAAGHCVVLNDAVSGAAQFVIEDNAFQNCGGKGLYVPVMFAGAFRGNLFDEIGDNHLEVQGGSATEIRRNDFKTVESNKVALRVYSGNSIIANNNGIEPDSGAGAGWAILGRSTSAGDATDSYYRGTITGNNIEQFKARGLEFRSNSGATIDGNSWNTPTSGSVIAAYFEFVAGTETSFWTGENQINLQGAATWTNGQPIHARGAAPFIVIGTNTPAQFYEFNAAETRTLPYMRPSLLAGTTKNPLSVSELQTPALYDSNLAGTLTGIADPAGNAGRIALQNGSAARPVLAAAADLTTGQYFATNQILWGVGSTQRMLLNSSNELYVGLNAAGTGKILAQGLGAATGFIVRTGAHPGLGGGLVMPWEGGGQSFGPGVWWCTAAYNACTGLWLSSGVNAQAPSSGHSAWKWRASTGTSADGGVRITLQPDDGYIRLEPFGTGAGNTGEFRSAELAANGSDYVGLKAPDAISASYSLTLPTLPASTQCLQLSAAGVISAAGAACGSGGGMAIAGTVTSSTAGSVLFVNSGPVLAQDNANFYWDDTNNRLGVGIGTSPAAPVHVLADASNLGVRVKANAAAINVDLSSDGSVGFLGTTTNHAFEVWTNSTTRMRIEAGGLVGINDPTPGAQLDVTAGATGTIGAIINGASGATADLLRLDINGTSIVRFVPVSGDVNTVLSDGALATTATDGFVYFPSMAGAPTGAPTGYTGTIPLVVDSSNSRLYGRIGGAWVNLSGAGGSPGGSGSEIQYRAGASTFGAVTGSSVSGANVAFAPDATTGNGFAIAGSAITSGNLVSIAASGTAAVANTKTALNVATSGANATSTQTTYGAQIANTSTGTSSTNIALNLSASGGTTNYQLTFGGSTSIAIYQDAFGGLLWRTGSTDRFGTVNNDFRMASSTIFGWTSGTLSTALDTAFARAVAGVIRTTNGSTGAGGLLVGSSSATGTAGSLVVASANADSLTVGPNGLTNPILQVVANVASAATGVGITGNAAGSGANIRAISSGANENLRLGGKGSGYTVLIPSSTAELLRMSDTGSDFYWNIGSGPGLSLNRNLNGVSTVISFHTRASATPSTILPSGGMMGWGSWTNFTETADTGMVRAAAGVIRVNTGYTSGTPNAAGGSFLLGASTDSLTGNFTVMSSNAATNSIVDIARLGVNSTGTAASGFGGRLSFSLETSTTNDTFAGSHEWLWDDATHATRTSKQVFYNVATGTTTEALRLGVITSTNTTYAQVTAIGIAGTPASGSVALHSQSTATRQFLFNRAEIGTGVTDGTYFSVGSGGAFAIVNQESGVTAHTSFMVGNSSIGFAVRVTGDPAIVSGNQYTWTNSSTDVTAGTLDTGLARPAAAVIRATDGSTGPGTFSSAARTPAQITANQNDYAPGVGLFQRWSSDASRDVTGLAAGQAGQIAFVWNVGSNDLVLPHESASSTAANRFTTNTGSNITISSSQVAFLQYDATSSRWRAALLGGSGGGSVAPLVLGTDLVEQRNSTTTQVSRWYYTYTDSSNNQGLALTHASGGSTIAAYTNGTGGDDLNLNLNPAGNGAVILGAGPFARFDTTHNANTTTLTGVLKLGNDFWLSSNLAAVGLNTYYNGTNFVYSQTDPAFLFGFNTNRAAFKIQAAASGTAGNTVTFSAGLAVLADATIGVNKESSTGAQLHAVSASASRTALRADSAASNTADVIQFTVNGSTTAGDYVGLAAGGAVKVRRQTYSGSGTQTLNLANGSVHELTVTGTTTVALSNIQNGGFYIIAVIQDATGGRSVTLPSAIKLPGGSWVFTTTANARDEFHCHSDGTNLYCMPQADVK